MKRTIIYASIAALLLIIFIFQETAGAGKNTLTIPPLPDTLDTIILSRSGESLELKAPSENPGEDFEGWKVGPEEYPTDRVLISDLVTAGVLTELDIGKSHVIKINEKSLYTETLFHFINSVQSVKEKRGIEEIIAKRAGATSRMGGV